MYLLLLKIKGLKCNYLKFGEVSIICEKLNRETGLWRQKQVLPQTLKRWQSKRVSSSTSFSFLIRQISATMSNFSDELHHIQALISSNATSSKCLGYSTLLHFQQHSTDNPSSIQSLADYSHTLIVSIVSDVLDENEEM